MASTLRNATYLEATARLPLLTRVSIDTALLCALCITACCQFVDNAHVVLLQLSLAHAAADWRRSLELRMVADGANVLRSRIAAAGAATGVTTVVDNHLSDMNIVSGNLVGFPACIDHGLNNLYLLDAEVTGVGAHGACRECCRHHGTSVTA